MIDEKIKVLAQDKNFAAFTTLLPGGQPMTHMMWVDADDEYLLINTEIGRQKVISTIPLGRLSRPIDIAKACAFLASDEAEFITGVCMEVDGGRCV